MTDAHDRVPPTSEELRTAELTPAREAEARRLAQKPHENEMMICALINALDAVRLERDAAYDQISTHARYAAFAVAERDGAREAYAGLLERLVSAIVDGGSKPVEL